jgi:hypothetical protein
MYCDALAGSAPNPRNKIMEIQMDLFRRISVSILLLAQGELP